MTTKPPAPSRAKPVPGFDPAVFEVRRIVTAQVGSQSASISFEVSVHDHRIGQRIFCGLLDRELKSGMGFAVDTMTGELTDLVNDQGIIGYLNTSPIPEGTPFTLRLVMDKFGSTHICSADVAGETILYPAVLLEAVNEIGAVVGSTPADHSAITFRKAHLRVTPSAIVAA